MKCQAILLLVHPSILNILFVSLHCHYFLIFVNIQITSYIYPDMLQDQEEVSFQFKIKRNLVNQDIKKKTHNKTNQNRGILIIKEKSRFVVKKILYFNRFCATIRISYIRLSMVYFDN